MTSSVCIPSGTHVAPFSEGVVPRISENPSLPPGFPLAVESTMAWTGGHFEDSNKYTLTLDEKDLKEVHAALAYFKALNLDGDLVARSNFPLPTLGKKLNEVRRELHEGRGFGVVRGLDSEQYSVENLTTVYLGLQSYVADQAGRQDKKGNMLVHIIADASTKAKSEHHRHSTSPITFHNEEAGDIIGWLTRNTAASGGKCIISSSYTAYNVLAATQPELVRVLARSDWPFAFPKFHCRPVLFWHEGRLIINFGRAPLTGSEAHPRPDGLPALTLKQKEALDALERIFRATELQIQTQAGDMHFINNLAVVHRRDGFVNHDESGQQRHLVRMRVRDSTMGWSIPPELGDEWSRAFGSKGSKVWHLEPMPDGYFPLRSQPN